MTDDGRPKAPRGEKAKRTRERIIRAAEIVFVRDGYLDARIADIAKQAKVAHGSFYTYFDSKEDVFREVATAVVEDMYHSLDAVAVEERADDLIRAGNERFIDLYSKHASLLALIEQVATFNEEFRTMRLELRLRLVTRVEHSIARMLASGQAELDGLDHGVLANALAGMVDNFAYAWFILGEPFERDRAVSTLDEIWSRALGVNVGRAAKRKRATPKATPASSKATASNAKTRSGKAKAATAKAIAAPPKRGSRAAS